MGQITAFGAYVPRLRIPLHMIAGGQPGAKARADAPSAERTICNWDEDSITMAVEAARDCLEDDKDLDAVCFASTTAPFADRQNAGVVAGALDLGDSLRTYDIGGSQRAGTTALLNILLSGTDNNELLVVSENRKTKAGSPHEARFGDGAVALVVGKGKPIVELLGSATRSVDFVDHFRASDEKYDYYWEERWIRDEGVMKIVPDAVSAALGNAALTAEDIDHVILPSPVPKVRKKLGDMLGFTEVALAQSYEGVVGDTGCAHPLFMLAGVLAEAKPGQTILVASFGQGCDVLIFRATAAITEFSPRNGVSGAIKSRRQISDYAKHLSFSGLIERELGMRAETDNKTALTQAFRRRDLLHGLIGGECEKCGTRQIPRSRICIHPDCNALDTQQPFGFSEIPARVVTWSADHLSFSLDPPSYYGLIEFEGGGRMFANFGEIVAGDLEVGSRMRMSFRIKDFDRKRNFRRYFWKAVPDTDPHIPGGV